MCDEPSPYAVLGQILTSKKVGLAHVHLVGEVVVESSLLSRWLGSEGKARLSADEWVNIVERALECEDRYKAVWASFGDSGNSAIPSEGLSSLEAALQDAVRCLRSIRKEIDS